ncbi:hypothetical protein GCM10027194_31020 [Thalassiella azotivora]
MYPKRVMHLTVARSRAPRATAAESICNRGSVILLLVGNVRDHRLASGTRVRDPDV